MPSTKPLPTTDSPNDLRPLVGDDATATFEDDPNFVESDPTGRASSENLEEQRSAADRNTPASRDTDDTEDEDDEDDDDLEDVDDDEEDEEDDEDDLEEDLEDDDDDEGLDDDEDEEEDDEDFEDDEDDDEDEEDDADEVSASSVLRADGLLGYEDEADDAREKVDRKKGDEERAEEEVEIKDGERNYDPYSHEDGKWLPIEKDDVPEEEGTLVEDRKDDPNFVPPYRAAVQPAFVSHVF